MAETTTTGITPGRPVTTSFAATPVLLVAGALTVTLLATASSYGPHRDELYFIAAGQRLAWGYPDQPSLTPLVARIADELAPGSLVALRLSSAVAMGLVVVLAALTARELGGGRAAQLLTAITTGTGVVIAVLGHLLSTASLDTLCWTAVVLLTIRTLTRDEPSGWLLVGLVGGLGLENKHLMAFLLAAIALGVALTPAVRHHLRAPAAWLGAGIALALWLPNLIWQATHDWPQLTLAGDIREEYLTLGERLGYAGLLLVLFSPLATPLWIYGLVRLLRAPTLVRARPIGWAFLVLGAVFFVTGGKAYYLAGIIPALIAAGAVGLEARWSTRRLVWTGATLALAASLAWPMALPLLPASTFADSPYAVIGEEQAETIGWPAFVATVRRAVAGSGAPLVLAQNYGEAGALAWYGVGVPVYSGHNAFGDWGPPPDTVDGPVVLTGYARPPGVFEGCRDAGRVDNGLGLDNEEQGGLVWVCDGPVGSWQAVWPEIRHLDG